MELVKVSSDKNARMLLAFNKLWKRAVSSLAEQPA